MLVGVKGQADILGNYPLWCLFTLCIKSKNIVVLLFPIGSAVSQKTKIKDVAVIQDGGINCKTVPKIYYYYYYFSNWLKYSMIHVGIRKSQPNDKNRK